MNRDRRTRLATNRWHDSRVQFRAYLPSLIHCSAVLEGVVRFYNGRWTAVMFVTMKPTRGRRDGHGHRRTVRLHHARRPSTARNVTGPEPIKVLSVDGAGVEPVAGYGASPAPFPQFLPRWARAEALDRPTGTTVAALDARRRVPRRPDVVQLDAGEIAGNDRVPLGGRVRPRPRPCSWSTCAGRDSQESGSRPSKSLISRRSPRNRPHSPPVEALRSVGVVSWYLDPSRQRVAPVRGHARQRAHSHIEHQGDGLQLARSSVARATHTCV